MVVVVRGRVKEGAEFISSLLLDLGSSLKSTFLVEMMVGNSWMALELPMEVVGSK